MDARPSAKPQSNLYAIRAVDRVCDILDALQESDQGVSLTALAARASLPKSSTLRYLSALENRDYVERDAGTGTFKLGLAFRHRESRYLESVRTLALPHLLDLRDRFGETVNLGILDGSEVVHVAVAESTKPVRLAARHGERAPLHSTAIGKVISTTLDHNRLREILDRSGMAAITAETITSAERFAEEVALTAERGYGLDDGENQIDGRCVAVGLDGLRVPGAVSVSAPASRLAAEDAPRVAHQLRKHLAPLAKELASLPNIS